MANLSVAGELLGRSWGLSRGDEGSVVLLDASPIEDIHNSRKIHAVVHHGVPVDREALAEKMFPAPSRPKGQEASVWLEGGATPDAPRAPAGGALRGHRGPSLCP